MLNAGRLLSVQHIIGLALPAELLVDVKFKDKHGNEIVILKGISIHVNVEKSIGVLGPHSFHISEDEYFVYDPELSIIS